MSHAFQILFVSSVLYQLVSSTSQNKGALQESFFIKLKTIKNECETNTANLLSVIDDLQQNENTSLVKDLNQETQFLKKMVEDLKRTIGHQQQMKLSLTGHDVHFVVYLSMNAYVNPGHIIPFNTIKSNIGNGYDENTYKFRPPYNGTYEFTLQIMTIHNSFVRGEISVNGQWMCRAHTAAGKMVFMEKSNMFKNLFLPFIFIFKFIIVTGPPGTLLFDRDQRSH